MSNKNRRERQRENRRKGRLEENLNRYNEFGQLDLTPYQAVNQINKKQKAAS